MSENKLNYIVGIPINSNAFTMTRIERVAVNSTISVPFYQVPLGYSLFIKEAGYSHFSGQAVMDVRIKLTVDNKIVIISNPLYSTNVNQRPFGELSYSTQNRTTLIPGRPISKFSSDVQTNFPDNFSVPEIQAGLAYEGQEVFFSITNVSKVYTHAIFLKLSGYLFPASGRNPRDISENFQL